MPEEREQARSVLERAYDVDETRASLLDAAFELFCRLGIQRTSMEEVTRKFASKDALLEQLILRELRRYFAHFLDDIAQAETAGDRVVANPLIGGLLRTASTSRAGSMIVDISDDAQLATVARQFLVPMLEPRR